MPTVAFPPKARAYIYWIYLSLGLIIGSVQVYFAAADLEVPDWFGGIVAIFAFLGAGFGFTAASNTTIKPEQPQE